MKRDTLVSIVIPVFNESENIDALLTRLLDIERENPAYLFEFIAVDDGSRDDTLRLLQGAVADQPNLTVVELSRNFGSHSAITAGMSAATGNCVAVLGADLQEPITLVGSFLEAWENGSDIVWGVRESRSGEAGVSPYLSSLFTRLLTGAAHLDGYPEEGPSGVLCDRRVIEAVLSMPERNRNVLGLIAWSGFSQSRVAFELSPRNAGSSKWTMRKKIKLAVDSFVQFSFTPIRVLAAIGGIVALLGFAYAAFLIVRSLVFSVSVPGWTTVVVLVLIIGGLQLVMLGVLGEYLWRNVDETRHRPLFIVKSVTGRRERD